MSPLFDDEAPGAASGQGASTAGYLQVVATHAEHPGRAVVRTQNGEWLLWFGTQRPAEPVTPELASWLIDQPVMDVLPGPLMWWSPDALPESGCPCAGCQATA